MQFSFSASGSPAEVADAINQQAKAAGREAWPVASAIRDHIAQQLAPLPAEQRVTVQGSVSVVLTGAERAEPAGKITSVATGTVGVESKAVAAVGEDRVIATDPADAAPYPAPDEAIAPGSIAAAAGRRASDRK